MIIKCGRKEYAVNSEDVIMYNTACYQLVSQCEWREPAPHLSKALATKLIKDGSLKEFKRTGTAEGKNLLIYYSPVEA